MNNKTINQLAESIRGCIKTKIMYTAQCMCGNTFQDSFAYDNREVFAMMMNSCGWKVTQKGKMYEVICPECVHVKQQAEIDKVIATDEFKKCVKTYKRMQQYEERKNKKEE
jgi:hypothetical protein